VSPRARAAKRLALAVGCTAILAGGAAAASAPRPRIAGPDVVTGRHVSLNQLGGKAVFVNVWGSWCDGCRVEAPVLSRFARMHAHQVAFLGIDTIDSKTGARAFVKRYRLTYPSIWDPRGTIAGGWSRGAPTTLVFDSRHRLVDRIEGSASLAELNAALRRVRPT
jgi:thiol-disulfide isomerase/thioredoxin